MCESNHISIAVLRFQRNRFAISVMSIEVACYLFLHRSDVHDDKALPSTECVAVRLTSQQI